MALNTPCQKEEEEASETLSPLCTKLLQLWSLGKISASQLAELAHLNLLEGSQHKETLALAKCGGFGKNPGNAHRDLLAYCCKTMNLPQPFAIQVPLLDLKTQKETLEDIEVLLPHLLFSNLYENYHEAFQNFFAFSKCKSFWQGVEAAKDPRLAAPLAKSGKVEWPSSTLPVFVHGDGCEFMNRDSLMTWSWGSMLSTNSSLSAHLSICAIPKRCTLPSTWPLLDQWMVIQSLGNRLASNT